MNSTKGDSSFPQPRRFPVGLALLGLAGVLLVMAVVWRERQLAQWRQDAPTVRFAPRSLAPRFRLADHHRHVVKFDRFLGRQRVLVVFFDAQLGPLRDPRMSRILECHPTIARMGVEIVGISSATPFANLAAEQERGEKIPFPLLTDIDVQSPVNEPVHRLWGRYDEKLGQTKTGLFLVARDGTIALGPDGYPMPVENEQAALDALCQGHWPRELEDQARPSETVNGRDVE